MDKISFEEFQKLDLRVGKVLSAEKLESSDKLLKLEIDLGDPSTHSTSSGQAGSGLGKRQIIAGIAKYYDQQELIGKSFVVVANLEYRKLMGFESQGMILTADGEEPILISPIQRRISRNETSMSWQNF